MSHEWKNGDVFEHGGCIYILLGPPGHLATFIATRTRLLKTSDWYKKDNAKYLGNISRPLCSIKSKLLESIRAKA